MGDRKHGLGLFHRPRLTPLLLLVLTILGLIITPLAHAATFVGYTSSTTTCGTCWWPLANVNYADGSAFVSPLAGQLISVAIRTANSVPSSVPTSIVIATFPAGTNPATTPAAGCNNACGFVNAAQSFTVQDVETVSLTNNGAYQTVALASPVTVANNQWVAALWMGQGTANNYLQLCSPCNNGGDPTISTIAGLTLNIGSSSPTTGNSYSSIASNPGGGIIGGTFQATSSTGNTITVTQCYGNCGSPPVTLANTNSTHTINFNQSITLLYEFQSNLNGFVINITTNLAKTYTNGQLIVLGVYTITSCPLGQTPFSSQCPGLLSTSGKVGNGKGRESLAGLKIGVSNGQWVGVAVTAIFSGLDLNDTNTGINLFQTNEGPMPTLIQNAAPSNPVSSKMGLWTWIIGNVVTGTPPTSPSVSCQSFATIDCWAPAFINGACSLVTAACQTSAAILWSFILSMLFLVTMAASVGADFKLPMGELFIFLFVGWILIFAGLGLTLVWVPIFFIMLLAVAFSKHTGKYF